MTTPGTAEAPRLRDNIALELGRARERTLALCDLPDDVLRAQISPLMSPLVWDLAHVGNYEELWLLRELDGRGPLDPLLDDLYNAFEHPRWERPALPILGPAEARAYAAGVRSAALELLDGLGPDDLAPPGVEGAGGAATDGTDGYAPADRRTRLLAGGFVYGMVIQHEQQHDETLLATWQLRGAGADTPPGTDRRAPARPAGTPRPEGMRLVDGGACTVGTTRAEDPWAYDNELGAHTVEVAPFLLDATPVTNDAYLAFVAGGGYDDARLWSATGWAWRQEAALTAPEFWRPEGPGDWSVLRFGERLDLADLQEEPVQHVCFHEAEAFARWAGKRLPTEIEWEKAACWHPTEGRRRYPWGDDHPTSEHANLGQRHAGPSEVAAHPAGVSPWGVHGLVGDVWEWTASDFLPHPGFQAFPYAEYSAVFWGHEYKVLKGGSWAADPVAVRGSFRNWDLPIRRQIFCGFRCAKDA